MDMSSTQPAAFAPNDAAGCDAIIELARADLRDRGIDALSDVLAAIADIDLGESDEGDVLLGDIVGTISGAFQADPFSPAAYAAFAGILPEHAAVVFNILLYSTFGDAAPTPSTLTEAGVVSFVAALSAAGAHEQAAGLIAEAKQHQGKSAILHAAWIARCRWVGCSDRIEDHCETPIALLASGEDPMSVITERPFDVTAHCAAVRAAMIKGAPGEAANQLAVALSLPIGDNDKLELAKELALLATIAIVCKNRALFEKPRLRWALATTPRIAAAAAAIVDQRMAAGTLSFLDETEAAECLKLLRGFAGTGDDPLQTITGYPMRNGKPHVDIVWLEITNHCNQKCTFCPDMFREDARTWLPLDQVKQLIDQLADTISVGSMQLNAYGEPLLHPNIAEILAYIRERSLPFPTFFTSHGMTLVDKKLKQLSNNYPAGIAISLHNDSQQSYEATRSQKIGDYETLVARVTALMKQMVEERAPSHLRLYQMVSNNHVDMRVDEITRSAFPDSAERMIAHVRKWEAIARDIVAKAPLECQAQAPMSADDYIAQAFLNASHGDREHLPILQWVDHHGVRQEVFVSARPVGTYANLLLEYDPRWAVERKVLNSARCGFVNSPSLAIFATGKLGICCLDLNSTATFGSLSDFDNLHDALTSPQALRMFAQLSNGIATSKGCQICLGGSERHCETKKLPRPTRPAGHFASDV